MYGAYDDQPAITVPDDTGYDEYYDDAPTYEDTSNSLREFLEQNDLDESNWISGTEYGSTEFTIQKIKNGGYSVTLYPNGTYLSDGEPSLEIEFLEGKAYGYVTFTNSDGQLCEMDLIFDNQNGIPRETLPCRKR